MCFEGDNQSIDIVFSRFEKIAFDLGIDINAELDRVREECVINKCDYDFIVSRGEYLIAILFARVLGFKFLDAASYIIIKSDGTADIEATRKNLSVLQKDGRYVLGGFYGRCQSGGVKTFARGGSDYSGAVVAVCLGADVYENFTDTYGVQSANPSIVKNTLNVPELDYDTLHRLSQAGATVIYPNCLPLLKKYMTPLRVDNTFDHGHKSTFVTTTKASKPFFSITYEIGANINKETAQILCVLYKISLSVHELSDLFQGQEVYITHYTPAEFNLLTPASDVAKVVNQLHKRLTNALK
jgi:aspartate kinase